MFKEMRKIERKIPMEESIKLLKNGEYGVLSTVGDNGYAYGTPLNYVYYDESIYFHSANEGNKIDNINFNNNVCFCVVGKTQVMPEKFSTKYESTIVFGKAHEIDGEEKEKALIALINKYAESYEKEGLDYIKKAKNKTKVIKISIEYISGKARK